MNVTGALDFFMENGSTNFYPQWQQRQLRQRLIHGTARDKSAYFQALCTQDVPLQRIHQSLAGDQLEAVYLPDQQLAVFDGDRVPLVSPHLPRQYCALSSDLQAERFLLLHRDACPIARQLQAHLQQFERLRQSANHLLDSNRALIAPYLDQEKLQKQAQKFADLACKKAVCGLEQSRFLSAFTADGAVRFEDTLYQLASQPIAVQDDARVCAPTLLQLIHVRLTAMQVAHFALYCPFQGARELEGLIVPSTDFAIIATNSCFPSTRACKTMHATRFIDPVVLKTKKQRLKFCKKTAKTLLDEGVLALQQAKQLQDRLTDKHELT